MRLVWLAGLFSLGFTAPISGQTILRDVTGPLVPGAAGEPYAKSFSGVPPANVFKAVELAYRQAGIKPSSVDASAFRVTYLATGTGQKIGNVKVENAFDCGGDKKSPLAATLELTVSLNTVVLGKVGESEALMSAVATAAAPSDGSPAPVCHSKGILERKVEPKLLAFRVSR